MYDADIAEELRGGETNPSVPLPVGYRMLIALPQVSEKTEGGIWRPDNLREEEELATMLGFVVAMGPDCYKNEKKFPTGPWCQVGDWVAIKSYAGVRCEVAGTKFRLINDDTIEAVVPDPKEFKRG